MACVHVREARRRTGANNNNATRRGRGARDGGRRDAVGDGRRGRAGGGSRGCHDRRHVGRDARIARRPGGERGRVDERSLRAPGRSGVGEGVAVGAQGEGAPRGIEGQAAQGHRGRVGPQDDARAPRTKGCRRGARVRRPGAGPRRRRRVFGSSPLVRRRRPRVGRGFPPGGVAARDAAADHRGGTDPAHDDGRGHLRRRARRRRVSPRRRRSDGRRPRSDGALGRPPRDAVDRNSRVNSVAGGCARDGRTSSAR